MPLFAGIDVDAKGAELVTTKEGETVGQYRISAELFGKTLRDLKPAAVGIEHTGRLAEPYALIAETENVPLYYINSVARHGLNLMHGDRAKTDLRDARSISRALYVWTDATRRAMALYPENLFIRADSVAAAWTLRALISACNALSSQRIETEQRIMSARRAGNPAVTALLEAACDDTAEREAWKKTEKFLRENFETQLDALLAMPGIGLRTAAVIIATIHPAARFETVNQVIGYAGLHPSNIESGGKTLVKPHIPHTGNKSLRSALFNAALSQRTAETPQGEKYRRLLEKGHHDYSGRCAVANSMLKAAYAVLIRGKSNEQTAAAAAAALIPAIPAHLIGQSQYAKTHGITRQAVGDRIARGTLQTEEFRGRRYIVVAQDITGGTA